jgi:hypothetical protein
MTRVKGVGRSYQACRYSAVLRHALLLFGSVSVCGWLFVAQPSVAPTTSSCFKEGWPWCGTVDTCACFLLGGNCCT